MSSGPDRDQSLERLLKATLPGTMMPASSSACVDAEMLAAWSEGALPPGDAGQIDAHLADCARCQSLLAAFARTEPVAAAAAPLWQGWSLRWLVPITAASAAVVIWVLVTRETTPPPAQMARLEPPSAAMSPAPESVGPAPSQNATPSTGSQMRSSSADRADKEIDGLRAERRTSELDAVAAPPPAPPALRPDAGYNTARIAAPDVIKMESPPPGEGARAGELLRQPTFTANGQSAAASAQSPRSNAPAAAAAVAAEQTRGRAAVAGGTVTSSPKTYVEVAALSDRRTPIAEIVSTRPTIIGRAVRGGPGRGDIGADAPPTRWRVFAGGLVERSTNDGGSWHPVSMDAPAAVTTGSSPSDSVCWLIGPLGVVVLTTDGLRFERVPFPDQSELVSVSASSARQATVRTADGRAFGTSDGGATWQGQ